MLLPANPDHGSAYDVSEKELVHQPGVCFQRRLVLLPYEQDVGDQVGAGAAPDRDDPEVLKVEICFAGSSAPHLGHLG